MSNKLTPKEMKAFEKHLQCAFPHLGITVSPFPNMEWKINFSEPCDDVDAVKSEAIKWYSENTDKTCAFGKLRHSV